MTRSAQQQSTTPPVRLPPSSFEAAVAGVSPLSQEGLSHPTISPYETCMQMQYTGSLGSTGRSSWGHHNNKMASKQTRGHADAHSGRTDERVIARREGAAEE